MGAQEDTPKRKEFQKRTDDDIDSFLSRKDFQRSQQPAPAKSAQPEPPATRPVEPEPKPAPPSEKVATTDEEHEAQIKAARTTRAESEAYQDVAILRKKAHALGHKAAKYFHKYKANEAKAQKCSARAVGYREKSAERKEKARSFKDMTKEYEAELAGAAQGKSELSPESLRTKVAQLERKAAKQEEVARKNESKAAAQTAKAAKFRTKAAKFLEQNKLFESQAMRYSKRADNLERAGV
jgi:hypothetical protein